MMLAATTYYATHADPPQSRQSGSSKKGFNAGAIAGIIVAAIFVIMLFFVLVASVHH